MRARRLTFAAFACAGLLGLAGCGSDEPDNGRRALPADAFVDSVGVNVHMSYTDTAYRNREAVGAALRELGVRHVRDGIVLGRPDQYQALRALAAAGARADLIMGDPRGRFGTGTLEMQLATLKRALLGAAETVEGPNEYDSSGDPAWPRTLRGYQQRLFRGLRSDPALARLPVVGPSLIDGPAWPRVGDLTGALDFGNIHPYPGGEPPSESHLREELDKVRPASGTDPVFATETGYHNALRGPPGQQPGVSERAAAAYIPRLLLEHFKLGIRRTFLYELVDERFEPGGRDPEQHFGLLRPAFRPKPAFEALRNTLSLLRDRGPGFSPGRLDFRVTAGDPVRDLLLQKRDGRFYLVLWQPDVSLFNTGARVDVRPPAIAVRVLLGERAKRVRAYHPVESTGPFRSWDDARSLDLQLGGDAVVLEIQPG